MKFLVSHTFVQKDLLPNVHDTCVFPTLEAAQEYVDKQRLAHAETYWADEHRDSSWNTDGNDTYLASGYAIDWWHIYFVEDEHE